MGKKEKDFQKELIKELSKKYPDAIILKNDANYMQGIPDLSIFYGKHWAMLECKKSAKEASSSNGYQPNQPYYIEAANRMSFARVIYPENKEEVLNDLQRSFET